LSAILPRELHSSHSEFASELISCLKPAHTALPFPAEKHARTSLVLPTGSSYITFFPGFAPGFTPGSINLLQHSQRSHTSSVVSTVSPPSPRLSKAWSILSLLQLGHDRHHTLFKSTPSYINAHHNAFPTIRQQPAPPPRHLDQLQPRSRCQRCFQGWQHLFAIKSRIQRDACAASISDRLLIPVNTG
jgi:hypothetical protein